MEQKKKVLIITYYWPPSGGAGVQRWLKFAKYLPEYNIEPIILTVDPCYASYLQIDESLENEVSPEMLVFKTKSFEPLNFLSKIIGKKNVPYGGFTNVKKESILQIILRFIRGNFFIPDARVGWNRFAYKKAKEIISKFNIETVITTSPPHSTQLIGLKLKKNLNIKWIADFRDPWIDIYYYEDLLHLPVTKRIDKGLERKVLLIADKVITVGEVLQKRLEYKSGENKVYTISNGFDHDDFKGYNQEYPEIFTITYTGTLSDLYNINSFIEACKQIKLKGNLIKIRFVGNISENQLNNFKIAGLKENLEIIKYVPHEESIRYLFNSSVLLLVIPETKGNKEIITGKLFEYMATGIPVLGIGPLDGDAAKIIESTKVGGFYNYNDEENIERYIMDYISFFNEKKYKVTETCIDGYSRKKLTEKLFNII